MQEKAKVNSSSTEKTQQVTQSTKDSFKELASFLIFLIVLIVLIRSSVIGPYKIPSSSMFPTLHIGDHILVNKLSYGLRMPFVTETVWQYSKPARGDIVVFSRPDEPETPENELDINYIKRVMALPGETVEVRGRTVYINGKALENDSHAVWQLGGRKDFGPEVVPENHIFLMGDNRDQSRDSRFWSNGPFLDLKLVKGRAFFIYYNSELDFSRMFRILY